MDITSRKIFIFASILLILCFIAGYIYMVVTWTPIDSESKEASETRILETVAAQLGKNSNELTDDDLAQITELLIAYGELSDISFVEKFTNLQEFSLQSVKFPETEIPRWMKIASKFGMYDLKDRFFINLQPLNKLSKLQKIHLLLSPIKGIESLNCLYNLQELDVSDSQVSDLEPLRNLTNLQTLNLNSTHVSDVKPLKNLTKLQMLGLEKTQVADIETLKGLTNLQTLYLGDTPVSDIKPLENMKNLGYLGLHKTGVTDLGPLKNLTNLGSLVLNGTEITDLEPLKGLTNLRYLQIVRCKNITNKQIEGLKKVLPNLKISYSEGAF